MTEPNQQQEPDEELAQFLQDYHAQQLPTQPPKQATVKKFLSRLLTRS